MTVPTHFKIVFRGIFNGSPEEWTFSTKWERNVVGFSDAEVDNIGESGVTTAITNLLGTSKFPSDVICTEWRAYAIGTDGKAQGDIKLVDLGGPAGPSGSGSTKYPTQTSLAVTTVGASRGKAKFGRFYLPSPALSLGADWRISDGNADSLLTDVKTFLDAVSSAIDLPNTTGASDMLNISAVGTGGKQSVSEIRIGKTFDSVERRRRQMLEEYRVYDAGFHWSGN